MCTDVEHQDCSGVSGNNCHSCNFPNVSTKIFGCKSQCQAILLRFPISNINILSLFYCEVKITNKDSKKFDGEFGIIVLRGGLDESDGEL